MLHRSKSRLVAAAAAAGTVCALTAAGAATAAVSHPWNGAGSVPGAYTNATPGLSAIYRTGQGVRGTFVTWKGQNSNKVLYKFKIAGKWAGGYVPGALTTTSPAAAFYIDPNSVDAVI